MCMSKKADLKPAQGTTGIPVWIHMKHEHIVGFLPTYFIISMYSQNRLLNRILFLLSLRYFKAGLF